ncbi:hypothetical protein FJZ31_29900 [Candidatus Poribacteria bacterium]|nr:hypothetical protein [Candidatus Poribacteria bacterium]
MVNDNIYVIGGWGNEGSVRVVEAYDPVADKWTKKADIPFTVRGGALSTSAVGNFIYSIDGYVTELGTGVAAVWVYDTTTDTWTKGTDLPNPRGREFSCCHARRQNLCHRRDVGLLRPDPGCSNGGSVRHWIHSSFATWQALHDVGKD